MLIPYGTDAPMRRPPIGTFVLIGVNCLLYFLQDRVVSREVYVLMHGDGLNPVQWFWSAFAHAGIWHLIGNMIFLFAFGTVVESTMQTHKFISLYLLIAVIQNAAEQLMMIYSSGDSVGSLGASSAIYGLMMTGILCAPGRNVNCWWIVGVYNYFRIVHLEIPVMIFSLFYFLWDFGMAMFTDFQMSTPFLHASGGIVGFCLALLAFQAGWFESNGGDLKSLIGEALTLKAKQPALDRRTEVEKLLDSAKLTRQTVDQSRLSLKNRVEACESYLQNGHYQLAAKKIAWIEADHPEFELDERLLVCLINIGTKHQDWNSVMGWIEKYLNRYCQVTDAIRLRKARLLAHRFDSPSQALHELARINRNRLNERQQNEFRMIGAKCLKMRAHGVSRSEIEALIDAPHPKAAG